MRQHGVFSEKEIIFLLWKDRKSGGDTRSHQYRVATRTYTRVYFGVLLVLHIGPMSFVPRSPRLLSLFLVYALSLNEGRCGRLYFPYPCPRFQPQNAGSVRFFIPCSSPLSLCPAGCVCVTRSPQGQTREREIESSPTDGAVLSLPPP